MLLSVPVQRLSSKAGIALVVALLWSCGPVVFVDPANDDKEQLRFSNAERLSVLDDARDYFFFRTRSRAHVANTFFEVGVAEERWAIPNESLVRRDCGSGDSCWSAILPAGIPERIERAYLRVPRLGHEDSRNLIRKRLGPLTLSAEPIAQNTRVRLSVEDPIARAVPIDAAVQDPLGFATTSTVPFVRVFEFAVSEGGCAEGAVSELDWTEAETLPIELPTEFDDQGEPKCAHVRPKAPGPGLPQVSQSFDPVAESLLLRHTYVPPVRNAPMIVLPIFDLELPSEERCAEAQNLIRSILLDTAASIASSQQGAAEILELEPIQAARVGGESCRQTNNRTFSATSIAQQVRTAVNAQFPGEDVRILIVYAQNLMITIPESLRVDLQILRSELPESYFVAVSASSALFDIEVDENIPWIAIEDPSFRSSIETAVRQIWPFRSTVHSSSVPIPLTTPDLTTPVAFFRVCSSSERAIPVGFPIGAVFEPSAFGPGVFILFGLQPGLVPSGRFFPLQATTTWEACFRFCQRGPQPWTLRPACET